MAKPPEPLTFEEHRDHDHRVELAIRWLLVSALVAFAGLALMNVFGQHPEVTTASGGGATLQVSAPDRLRGGLFYMGRFSVTAERSIEHATLVLDQGWLESMHINTIEPAPIGEASRSGDLALDFGHIPAGDTLVAYLEFQVNPSNIGRRSQDVRLFDGDTLLAESERTVTLFP